MGRGVGSLSVPSLLPHQVYSAQEGVGDRNPSPGGWIFFSGPDPFCKSTNCPIPSVPFACPHVRVGGHRWNLLTERACFSSPGAFKTYSNLWEGRNQVISIQWLMSGEGHGQSPDQVRVVWAVPGQPTYESWTFPTSSLPHYHWGFSSFKVFCLQTCSALERDSKLFFVADCWISSLPKGN
jgi:hypothetical protein